MLASRHTCPARTAAGTAADGSGTAACPVAAACVLTDAWATDRASAAARYICSLDIVAIHAVGTFAADVGLPAAIVSACSFSGTSTASAAVVGVSAAAADSLRDVSAFVDSAADAAKGETLPAGSATPVGRRQ